MTTVVRALKNQWTLVSESPCTYQVEGEGVECYFTEALSLPTDPPGAKASGETAAKTLEGGDGRRYRFDPIGAENLYAYPKRNGAVIIVDELRVVSVPKTAFGEVAVAEYDIIAAWAFSYNINSELIEQSVLNGGTVSNADSFAILETGTNPFGVARIQTRKALKYQPGIGGLVRFTATFSQGVPASAQRIGIGAQNFDGLAFAFVNDVFGVVRVDDGNVFFTAQEDWSEGVFEGFDPTLLNVYQIQFQWLGGGEIRFFIEDPEVGSPVLVHRIKYANTSTEVTLQNPSLPLYAEVLNLGNTTNITLRTPSGSAGLEGNSDRTALRVTRASRAQSVDVDETALRPIVSISNPTTYKGAANRLTVNVIIASAGIEDSAARVCDIRLVRDATLTGESFTFVDEEACPVQEDSSATAMTGGTYLFGFIVARANAQAIPLKDADISIRPGETLTLAAIGDNDVDITFGSLTYSSEV